MTKPTPFEEKINAVIAAAYELAEFVKQETQKQYAARLHIAQEELRAAREECAMLAMRLRALGE